MARQPSNLKDLEHIAKDKSSKIRGETWKKLLSSYKKGLSSAAKGVWQENFSTVGKVVILQSKGCWCDLSSLLSYVDRPLTKSLNLKLASNQCINVALVEVL